jgi:hypothetical protein
MPDAVLDMSLREVKLKCGRNSSNSLSENAEIF